MDSYVSRVKANEAPLWSKKQPLLTSLDFELTERCNNNCVHCCINLPVNDRKARNRELSAEEIKRILREAVELGCRQVKFTGGEPLLREDFGELYVYARKLGLKVVLFTNATLIDARTAGLFSRIPPLEPIEVTVYGLKQESYESVTRNPGSFRASRQGLRRLRKARVPFIVKGTILPPNRSELAAFNKWSGRITGRHELPSYAMFFDLRTRRDSVEKNRQIKKLRLSPEEGLRIMAGNPEVYKRDMNRFCASFMNAAGRRIFQCGAGSGGGCVDAYGNLQMCLMLRHPDTVYNLRQGSLKDGFTVFFPRVRQRTAVNPAYLKRCAVCFLNGLCEQCPAKSWTEHGCLDKPVEYLCRMAHCQARFLGLLKKGQKSWQVKRPASAVFPE